MENSCVWDIIMEIISISYATLQLIQDIDFLGYCDEADFAVKI